MDDDKKELAEELGVDPEDLDDMSPEQIEAKMDGASDEVVTLMGDHDIDAEKAEKVQELMDEEGLDEDDALELADEI